MKNIFFEHFPTLPMNTFPTLPLDTFPTFKPLPSFESGAGGGGSLDTKKNFFAFLHDSEHVLILIFESGKK